MNGISLFNNLHSRSQKEILYFSFVQEKEARFHCHDHVIAEVCPIRSFLGKNPGRGSKRSFFAFLPYWHLPCRRFGHLVDMYGYNPHCKWADGPVATSSEYLGIPYC
jgi:hypothetical protein